MSKRDTAHDIELWVERAFDRLDKRLMRGDIGELTYRQESAEIDAKARERYRKMRQSAASAQRSDA